MVARYTTELTPYEFSVLMWVLSSDGKISFRGSVMKANSIKRLLEKFKNMGLISYKSVTILKEKVGIVDKICTILVEDLKPSNYDVLLVEKNKVVLAYEFL